VPVNLLEKNGKWFLYRAASLHLQFAEAANRDNQSYLAYTLLNQGLTTVPGRITRQAYPYDFDARKTDNPTYTADWSQNVGIRGRAYLKSDTIAAGADSVITIEDRIINEAGLELAYEGQRWSDLLRIALRRNDPNYLADKVYDKLRLEVGEAKAREVQARLKNRDNWFLPFK
jgi:starch-binding outer membrane protein, SusD/RagB family